MKYFRHESNAHRDPDLVTIIDEFGYDWYGRYWTIVGMIASRVSKTDLSFSLQTNNGEPVTIDQLARDLRTRPEALVKFLDHLAKNRLIDGPAWTNEQRIYCPSLKRRAEGYIKTLLGDDADVADDKRDERIDENSFAFKAARFFFDELKGKHPTLFRQTWEDVAAVWIKATEDLVRLDGHTENEVRRVFVYVRRESEFWSKQIRTVQKLREKDRQGAKYFDVMLERSKEEDRRKPARPEQKVGGITLLMGDNRQLDRVAERLKGSKGAG